MKRFEIEYRRTSFVVVHVEAETKEKAEDMAWDQLEKDHYTDNAEWEVETITQAE
jgi:hypothetical protein